MALISSIKFILIWFTYSIVFSSGERRPSHILTQYLKVCHRSDPLLNQCMKESIEKLKPFLRNGVPELSIPALEPLIIPEIIMNQGKDSNLNLVVTHKNLHLWGTSAFKIDDFRVNLKKNQIEFHVNFPQLVTRGIYTINGKISVFPIIGSGLKEGNYTNVEGKVLVEGSRVRNNGFMYYHVDNVKINMEVGHASIHFGNLFNGDKELGDAMNSFINENWKQVIKDMKPVLEQTIGEVLKDLFNKIYMKFPLEEILPR